MLFKCIDANKMAYELQGNMQTTEFHAADSSPDTLGFDSFLLKGGD